MDYREATYQLIEYLRRYERGRIALFAVSTDSATDMIKRMRFCPTTAAGNATCSITPARTG